MYIVFFWEFALLLFLIPYFMEGMISCIPLFPLIRDTVIYRVLSHPSPFTWFSFSFTFFSLLFVFLLDLAFVVVFTADKQTRLDLTMRWEQGGWMDGWLG